MENNRTLLEKADLALADMSTNGGLLTAEQSNAFIRKLINTPTILREARVVEMMASSRQINKIQFGKRILRAATSGTALVTAAVEGAFNASTEATARAKPTTEQILLNTKEVIAEIRLPYDVIEDNIERGEIGARTDVGGQATSGGIRDTLVTLIAERAALDMEELGLLGDTGLVATDPYLGLTNGWIKRTETGGNIVDVTGATLTKTAFKNGVKTMPDPYLRNRAGMKHYVSVDQETEYRDTMADRATTIGDNAITGMGPIYAFGSPISAVPLMPNAKGLFGNPLNYIMGIQRQVHFEYDKDISARMYIIVLTARLDFQVEEALASVAYNNIG
jgi:hypothetical protein